MRAELLPRTVIATQVVVVLLASLAFSGCKTEKDPDQPTILGIPPGIAYLGVEYSYNFGAYGGEDILDYSLTNAPSWLALEDTSNKARQGIIMRGVPGLTGGSRGDADLGKLEDINLVTTDGGMAGVQPFDIQVKHNIVSLEADAFEEGASPEIPDSPGETCQLPDLETTGEHSFSVNTYAPDGEISGTRDLTLPTRPVFAKISLDRPSVTRIAVAFELNSDHDPSSCDPNYTAPHQRCDHSRSNAGNAVVGQDIVALGSGSASLLEELPYLAYETDNSGSATGGVVTLEPGITECYIRLEVVDDRFPEPSEAAQLNLTEIRSGLAGLGAANQGVRTLLAINDNEPEVTLETIAGGARDTLNVGGTRSYRARLTGQREGAIRARLKQSEDSTARLGRDFSTSLANDELVFPEGVEEVEFDVEVVGSGSYTNAGPNDRVILLGLDQSFQLGRENYARAAGENMLRVSINELVSPLNLGTSNSFVATDVVLGNEGKMFVGGYDRTQGDQVQVRMFSQKGDLLQQLNVTSAGDSLSGPEVYIDLATREVTRNNIKRDRLELLVAFSTEGTVAGTTPKGKQDVVSSLYWYDDDSNGGEYVESWTTRTGTPADDLIRWAGLNAASGYVVVAGQTMGEWPGQNAVGGFDSFLQRIDSLPDGAGFVPALAWTRQVGSTADDHVAGASALSGSPILFGSARGAVNGEPVLGGVDAYFYSAASADGEVTVRQRGTADADERIADGLMAGSTLWLLGNGSHEYVLEKAEGEGEEEVNRLITAPASSRSSEGGFLLGYTTGGDISGVFNLNDDEDVSREQFGALTRFDGDLVAAGFTDGDFTGNATVAGVNAGIVARMSLLPEPQTDSDTDTESSVFRSEWRFQLDSADSEIIRLENYRDDEIVALTRQGPDWKLILFSPEGVLLTP